MLCDEERRRYRLLETIRHYAAERLAEAAEREVLRDRHLEVLCELQLRHFGTEMVEPGLPWPVRLAALTASRSLVDDQRAALDWAIESGNAPLGLRLCAYSTSLLPVSSANPAEIVGWVERLLALDLTQVPDEQIAHAQAYLAYGLEGRDELARSLEYATASLAGLGADNVFPSCVMHSLSVVVLLRMGRGRRGAAPRARPDLAVAIASGDQWNQAAGLAGLSAVALTRGRLREAQCHGEEALVRARQHGHRWLLARTATQLGAVAEARGDLVKAMAQYDSKDAQIRQERAACAALEEKLADVGAALDEARTALQHSLDRLTREHEAVLAARENEIEQLRNSLGIRVGELNQSRAENHRVFQQAPMPMFRCTNHGVLTRVESHVEEVSRPSPCGRAQWCGPGGSDLRIPERPVLAD